MKWNDVKKIQGTCTLNPHKHTEVTAGFKDKCNQSCLNCEYFEWEK